MEPVEIPANAPKLTARELKNKMKTIQFARDMTAKNLVSLERQKALLEKEIAEDIMYNEKGIPFDPFRKERIKYNPYEPKSIQQAVYKSTDFGIFQLLVFSIKYSLMMEPLVSNFINSIIGLGFLMPNEKASVYYLLIVFVVAVVIGNILFMSLMSVQPFLWILGPFVLLFFGIRYHYMRVVPPFNTRILIFFYGFITAGMFVGPIMAVVTMIMTALVVTVPLLMSIISIIGIPIVNLCGIVTFIILSNLFGMPVLIGLNKWEEAHVEAFV